MPQSPRPLDPTTLSSLPSTGIVLIGIKTGFNLDSAFEVDDVVKELASELKVLAIVHGDDLQARVRDATKLVKAPPTILHCTFQECDPGTAFQAACTCYHRRKDELHDRQHPVEGDLRCPDPLCDGI